MSGIPATHIDLTFQHGAYYVTVDTRADSREEAYDMAESMLKILDKGKEAHIRAAPSAVSETNAETGVVVHRGHVSFIFRGVDGPWTYPDPLETSALPVLLATWEIPL